MRRTFNDAPELDANTWAISRIRAYLERPNAQLRAELRHALRGFYDTKSVTQHLIPKRTKVVNTFPSQSKPPSRPLTSLAPTLSQTSYNASNLGQVGLGSGPGSGSGSGLGPGLGPGLGLGSSRSHGPNCLVLHIRHNDAHSGKNSLVQL